MVQKPGCILRLNFFGAIKSLQTTYFPAINGLIVRQFCPIAPFHPYFKPDFKVFLRLLLAHADILGLTIEMIR